MYAYITGRIEGMEEGSLILDNNGIGYLLYVSNNCLSRIGNIGQTVKIYTYLNIREDEMSLYGFYSLEEREMFLKLISISGIGPKIAVAALSGIELKNLQRAIVSGDTKTLSTIKGIGKKTAERIVLELRGGFESIELNIPTELPDDSINDAVQALVNLGISRQEAYTAVMKASEETIDTSQLVAKALRSLYR